ncbi:unnamed protein product [Paramecium primaurelia]|uniref:TLDc domain-containing protein n=1 Tax=Paramecium primaurelia TaxID=5886 RepID=A0A8S1ME24_PARPR|nr:unnamed protein product [Paramecium primaurelia]
METKNPDEISKRFCQMHDNYEIIAVDLNISCNKKFLCAKCLLDMIGTKSIVLYDKAIQMIKDMKNKSDEQKSELNKIKLQNLKQLQNSTAQFEGLIKNTLSKLSDSIEHQIIENQNELDTSDSQLQTVDLEEDIQILSTNYKENEEFNMPVQNIDKSKLSQFFDSIKESLIQLQSSQHFNQINQLIENIEKQLSINQDTKNKQIEEYKTPSLNQLCSKHNYQIISVNLNQIQNNENLNRLACIQCIQEVPIQYVTLNETSKRWNQFVEQQDEMKSKYQRQREFKIKTAIKFIQQLKQQYQQILTDIIQSLNDQLNQVIEDSQQIKQMDISVFLQLDEKSIQQIVNILSLKDQHHSLKTIQENTDKDYTQFQQQLISKLNNLIQQELIIKEKLIKISNNNESEQLDESEFEDIKDNPNITQFLQNCRLQSQYLQIVEDSFNFYKNFEIQVVSQTKSELSYFIQLYYQQFQFYSNKMKTLIKADDTEKSLTQLQQEKLLLQNKLQEETQAKEQNQQELQSLQNQNASQQQQLTIKIEELNQKIAQAKSQEQTLQQQLQEQTNQYNEQKKQIEKFENQTKYQELQTQINNLNQTIKSTQLELQQKTQQIELKDKEFKNLQEAFPQIQLNLTLGKITLLKDDYYSKLLKTIEDKAKKKIKNQYLIYCGTKDGLKGESFWKSVNGMSNLLMVFKSKSDHIFGGYSPCQWYVTPSNFYVADNTLSSFLFSQTHNKIYPLQSGKMANAIYCHKSYGPTFGGGHDLQVSSDFNGGYSNLGNTYQWDEYQNAQSNHLFGQSTPQIVECEIIMLTFM